MIINVEVNDAVTVYVTLPGPDAGLSKLDIARIFARELSNEAWRFAGEVLGRPMRLNGRMTVEMALLAGMVASRLGAASVELFDPATGAYTPVTGEGGVLEMPVPVLPGMIVEVVKDGGLFRRGAEAVVLNVGHEQVNIASLDNRRSERRDTGWTAKTNVRPVRWERPPRL